MSVCILSEIKKSENFEKSAVPIYIYGYANKAAKSAKLITRVLTLEVKY